MFKLFGGLVDSNERELKRLKPLVSAINSLEPDFEGLSDAELRGKTDQFKARYRDGEKLDDLLPETFAAVRHGLLSVFDTFPSSWQILLYSLPGSPNNSSYHLTC